NESWYGSVHIAFELYKTASNDIVWQDEFSKKTPVAQKEPVEVVKAISESLQKVIEQARMEIEKSLRN
ncbi:MAG: hypothetical protein GWN00_26935, partial [Aliifodinibius sp.]|nr:hypothetical protein [Fodinibius sp.]NIV15307.1 hypothetical protein [Fodinibius sp.]NIY28307.1 hypothetical protein [Fodinibius sp.]